MPFCPTVVLLSSLEVNSTVLPTGEHQQNLRGVSRVQVSWATWDLPKRVNRFNWKARTFFMLKLGKFVAGGHAIFSIVQSLTWQAAEGMNPLNPLFLSTHGSQADSILGFIFSTMLC